MRRSISGKGKSVGVPPPKKTVRGRSTGGRCAQQVGFAKEPIHEPGHSLLVLRVME